MTGNPENVMGSMERDSGALSSAPRSILDWLRRIAVNDWVVLGYLSALDAAIIASPNVGPARDRAILEMSGLLSVFFVVVVVLIRGGLLRNPILRPLAFRVCHYGGIQLTYFFMRGFLPVVNPGSLDLELHQLGVRLFGFEPALAMEHWVSDATTEWFAFFYYGYFFVLGLHVVPILFVSRNARMLSEFALGLLIVLALGQSMYLLVPGYGPAHGLPTLFRTELPDGVWWNLVNQIV